jgi:hypothetical protein
MSCDYRTKVFSQLAGTAAGLPNLSSKLSYTAESAIPNLNIEEGQVGAGERSNSSCFNMKSSK